MTFRAEPDAMQSKRMKCSVLEFIHKQLLHKKIALTMNKYKIKVHTHTDTTTHKNTQTKTHTDTILFLYHYSQPSAGIKKCILRLIFLSEMRMQCL